MNRQRNAGMLFSMTLLAGLSGCWDRESAQEAAAEKAPVENPAPKPESSVTLQKEINETQAAIAEAVEMQDKLATEIEVLQQLLEETETELAAHEEEVSRLEARQNR
ncbi:MAG TPA: hypothetical protein VF268_06500 [Gammaproteobacteria bacterium]|jgi:hypothetical protein